MPLRRFLLLLAASYGPFACAQLAEPVIRHSALLRTPAGDPVTDRIIVKWRDVGVAVTQVDEPEARAQMLRGATGLPLKAVRSFGGQFDVLRLSDPASSELPSPATLRAAIARLKLDPFVEYAEADERVYALAAPNDPRYIAGSDALGAWTGQWYLGAPSATTPAATDVINAWDYATGVGVIVAVIDSGIRADHPDLAGQLLSGRDFVCNDNLDLSCNAVGASLFLTANDNTGWDTDPADPGDSLSAADLSRTDNFFNRQCGDGPNHDQPIDSTWHGTRVAGIVAALTNNNLGIASVARDAKVVPVRALGRCGGYTSDLVASMLWAAGISDTLISGITAIPNRAQILNLSLGNRSACSTTEQNAIDRITAAGTLIVAAAGNDGGPIGAPANCTGVLSVAGVRHIGTKVGYSNVSSTAASISIAAPAGNCVNTVSTLPCLYAIDTLTNEGKSAPVTVAANPGAGLTSYTYAFFNQPYTGNKFNAANVGTSFAAPVVAGVAALMMSGNRQLLPAEVIARMRASATPFPTPATAPTGGTCHVAALTRNSTGDFTDVQDRDCQCTTATCGAGLLNAAAALTQALRPIAIIVSSSASGNIGQRISLDGSTSRAATGHRVVSYQWTADPNISISNATGAVAEIIFPATRPVTMTLVITDEAGRTDTVQFTILSTVTGDGTGRGSGGSLEFWALLALLAALITRELKPRPTVAMLCTWVGEQWGNPGARN